MAQTASFSFPLLPNYRDLFLLPLQACSKIPSAQQKAFAESWIRPGHSVFNNDNYPLFADSDLIPKQKLQMLSFQVPLNQGQNCHCFGRSLAFTPAPDTVVSSQKVENRSVLCRSTSPLHLEPEIVTIQHPEMGFGQRSGHNKELNVPVRLSLALPSWERYSTPL